MARHLSMAEWIGKHSDWHRRELVGNTERKLDIIRTAARHDFPVSDIAGRLTEIEIGDATGWNRHGLS